MKQNITLEKVRSWNPCYDPVKYLRPGVKYTALDILNKRSASAEDRLWCVLRSEVLDDKTLRLFAVKCAREVLKPDADPRSHKALEVAERFAYGKASKEELGAAWAAAGAAALDAADAAWDAADAAGAAAHASPKAARAHQIKILRELIKKRSKK